MTVTDTKQERKRAQRIPHITADAAHLGVSREHLTRALRGERDISKSLLLRYDRLQKKKSQMKATK